MFFPELSPEPPPRLQEAMPNASRQRWDEMLRGLADLLPAGPASVLVDGAGEGRPTLAARLSARLAATLNASGRDCVRLPVPRQDVNPEDSGVPGSAIRLADDSGWRQVRSWDVVIWLRTAPGSRRGPVDRHEGDRHDGDRRDGEDGAAIVIDLHDQDWPVIRRVAAPVAARGRWYL